LDMLSAGDHSKLEHEEPEEINEEEYEVQEWDFVKSHKVEHAKHVLHCEVTTGRTVYLMRDLG
jgi:hypothetical protein